MQTAGTNRRSSFAAFAVVLLALLWLLWPSAEAAQPLPPPAEAPRAELPPSASADGAAAAAARTELTDAPPEPAPEADLDHPFAFSLQVKLLDAFGLPVQGGLVFAGPPLCGFSLWPTPSDARGDIRLQWHGRVRAMQLQLAVLAWGVLQPLRRIDVEADRLRQLTLVVRAREQSQEAQDELLRRPPEQRFEDAKKVRRGRLRRTDDLDVLCGRTLLLFREFECANCHTPSRIAGYSTLARCGDMQTSLHPFALFQDLRAGGMTAEQQRDRQRLLQQSELDPEAREQRRRAERARVIGTVLDADGAPAANVPVAWLSDGALKKRTMTNQKGQYRLEPVAAGLLELVAGGGDGGDARAALVAVNDNDTEWNCQLARNGVVRGTARDETGGVLVDWRVEFERGENDWADVATTQKDGSFVLTSAPGPGQCLLWPSDADLRLPVLFGRMAMPDSAPLQLDLARAQPTRARLRVHVVAPEGCDWAQVDARVCQIDTGRMAQLTPLGHEEGFELDGLAAGPYHVEVGAAVLGWIDCGITNIDGRGLWDLGTMRLPQPGRVRLHLAPGMVSPLRLEHALYRRTQAVDVQESYRLDDKDTLLLAAGEHLLLWRDKHGLRSATFRVASGTDCDVSIAAD